MNEVPILIVDDEMVDFSRQTLPKTVLPYRFVLDYKGPIQSDEPPYDSRVQLTRHLESLKNISGNAIVLLDLGLAYTTLGKTELTEVQEWFHSVVDSYVEQKRMVGGLYVLKKMLENPNWTGEVCIASSYVNETIQDALEKSLGENGFTKENKAIRRGGVYVRFLRSLSNAEQTDIMIQTAITHFLTDFDPIWWFLRPPKLVRTTKDFENAWFPHGAHDPQNGVDFKTHLNAVKARFPRWELTEWAKTLVSADKEAPYSVMKNSVTDDSKGSNFVAVECLLDFFGDHLELENLEPNDQIQLPTIPAFPFLIAVQKLLNALASDQHKMVLRKMPNHVIAAGIRDLEPLNVSAEELSDRWKLTSRLWGGETDEAKSQTKSLTARDVRIGTVLDAFRYALSARTRFEEEGDLPELAGLLKGLSHVATPWITETFVGVSWKSQHKPSRRS